MFPRRHDFIEKTLNRLAESMGQAARADDSGADSGFLQRLDPRVKLAGFLGLIFAAAASQRLAVTAAILAVGLTLALASRVLGPIARLWSGVLVFTGMLVLPAAVLTPGAPLFHLPWVGWPITDHGLRSAASLIARAETTATLAALLVLTTRWGHLLKALRVLRVPALLVVILGMTYRFIFVLLGSARDFARAKWGASTGGNGGRWPFPARRCYSAKACNSAAKSTKRCRRAGFAARSTRWTHSVLRTSIGACWPHLW